MLSSSATDRGVFRNPLEVFASGWTHRTLVLRLARREIEARYRGSLLGLAWSLLVPFMLLAVYTFVFSAVFNARWDIPIDNKWVFALILFSGLTVFNIFAEVVQRAPTLVLENVNYVKRVVFPLECLAWVALVVALFNAGVSAAALLIGYVIILGWPPLTLFLWPIVLVPLMLATLGVCWLAASLGVYLRDLRQFMPVLVTVLLFSNPVLFPMEQLTAKVPDWIADIIEMSPIAAVIEQTRDILFRGELPDPVTVAVLSVGGWLIAWLGYMWFCKTRKGFADVT